MEEIREKPLSILFVCHEYPPNPHGGIGTMTQFLAENLSQQGISVGVIGFDLNVRKDEKELRNGVHVWKVFNPYKERRATRRILNPISLILERLQFSRKLQRIEANFKPDLIECHEWGGPLLLKPKTKLVYRLHGAHGVNAHMTKTRARKIIKFFERRNLKMGDYFIPISNHIQSETEKVFGLKIKGRATIIPNGLDLSSFSEKETGPYPQKKLGYVGRIHPQKGIAELIKVFCEVYKQDPSYTLTLIGPYASQYRQKIEVPLSDEIRKQISWLGLVSKDQVPGLLKNLTALCVPTKTEAFGLTVLEGMAAGRLVFANPIGAIPEIIKDGENGVFLDYSNPAPAAGKMLDLLSNTQAMDSIIHRALETVKREYGPDTILERNLSLYNSIAH